MSINFGNAARRPHRFTTSQQGIRSADAPVSRLHACGELLNNN
jgi:hypothetical protein